MDWNDPSGKLNPEDMESPLFRSECEQQFTLASTSPLESNVIMLKKPVRLSLRTKRVAIVVNNRVYGSECFELKNNRLIFWLPQNAGFSLKHDDDIHIYIEE